ncbi:proteasome assembly chaperone family protein [Candidatus Woesearchaeota archaeon]|nr:proteasome assembly chaperone family protein [Candidatus Woesearchaeota archaeon]
MQVVLHKKPKSPIIIEGFPGFGLVGTITTEFLIKHLDAQQIGYIRMEEVPPVVPVHQGKAIEPIGIFYSSRENLVVLHALTSVAGFEWELARDILQMAKDLKAKEIISLEGVGSNNPESEESRTFYLGDSKKLKSIKQMEPLKEGIIMGVTGALLLHKDFPINCIFAETHSALPDSRAAANIMRVLDDYLGLKIDVKPLLEKAEDFEEKIKDLLTKAKHATETHQQKTQSYFG